VLAHGALSELLDFEAGGLGAVVAGALSLLLLAALQFSRHLLLLPANIAASYNYRLSRLYPYWQNLTPGGLKAASTVALFLLAGPPLLTGLAVLARGDATEAFAWLCPPVFYGLLGIWLRPVEAKPVRTARREGPPNIVMLGSDTLRSDRLDGTHARDVAPNLSRLAGEGALFSHCYVPCARTAPSLISMLTGVWPHRFGVRDNFVTDEQTRLGRDTLASILKRNGYRTAALSDWCGADIGKFDLGFENVDVPKDQWNIKLLIRQGPKDLRLFLSLFTRNRFGKRFLPEIYYMGGVPMNDELGRNARQAISALAAQPQPFLLNIFLSTTHGPFGSEYPYYLRYAEPGYQGESKFVMARLTDPFEIIRRQGEPRGEFDLDQIINLYDGCVTRLDDEVKRIVDHLEQCGLGDNTLLVIYSDHGMEFFEHNTWGQGNSAIADVSNRVPLVIRGLGLPAQPTTTKPVRAIDLMPTLLELAGIAPPQGIDGVSLAPYLHASQPLPKLEAFSETGIWLTELPGTPADHLRYPNLLELLTVRNKATGTISLKPEYESAIIRAKDRMIRHGRWKLVYQPLRDGHLLKLYDMKSDPGCTRDVGGERPDVVQELWLRLADWIGADPIMARDPEKP
jgi:arylsulfatase A-like enzyme